MPLLRKVYTRFNGGMVSREIASRSDRDFFYTSAEELINVIPLLSGPVIRRGGTQYLNSLPLNESIFYQHGVEEECTAEHPVFVEFKFAVGECYLLVFISNALQNDRTEVLIYTMSGELEAALCQMQDGSAIPTQYSQFSYLRYRQKGDTVYFVDSHHAQYKIMRMGGPEVFTWTAEFWPFADDPGSAEGIVRYTLMEFKGGQEWQNYSRTCTNQGWPANGEQLESAFLPDYGKITTENHSAAVKSPAGNDLLAAWGTDGRYDFPNGYPAYLPAHGYFYALRLTGSFAITPGMAGRYSFGLNLLGNGDFSIDRQHDNDVLLGIYGLLASAAVRPRDHTEFILANNTLVLDARTHYFQLRFIKSNQASTILTLGWRKDSSTAVDGVAREGEEISTVQFKVIRKWFGYRIFEIQIQVYDFSGSISLRWRWRHIRDVEENTPCREWKQDWSDSVEDGIPVNGPYPINADDPYSISFEDNHEEYGNIGGTIQAADIYFMDPSKVQVGDIYTFRVGFLPIPLSLFQYRDPYIQTTGYPICLEFHAGRLMLGGVTTYPYRLSASKVFSYEVFTIHEADDDSAFESNIIEGGQLNQINWLSSLGKLIIGTVGGVHILPHNDELLTPSNSKSRAIERIGTAFVEPAIYGRTVFFVDNSRTQIYALSYDELQGYGMINVSARVESLFTQDHLKTLCFQQGAKVTFGGERHQILWCLTDSGKLYGLSWEMPNEFQAWHMHSLQGEIQSMAALPAEGGDRLYFAVKETIGDTPVYFIVLLEPMAFADCAAAAGTMTGFQDAGTLMDLPAHLSGLGPTDLIHAWVYREQDGIVSPVPLTLRPAACTEDHRWELPIDFTFTTEEPYYVGYAYEPVITMLPPEFTLADGSTTQGWARGWESLTLRTSKSSGLLEIQRIMDRRMAPRIIPATLNFADRIQEFRYTILGYDFLGQIRIKQVSPACLEILLIEGSIEYDR